MALRKPIIFIKPLSESLARLLVQVDNMKEAENLEILEIDNPEEVDHTFNTVGPSFTILSSPKKCAMLLTTHKKYIKNNKCKIILLSPKPIPGKIIKRLEKLGLTECIIEPVPDKTLFYKAKIHIKSIKLLVKPTQDSTLESGENKNDLDENKELKVKTIKQKIAEAKEQAEKERLLKEDHENIEEKESQEQDPKKEPENYNKSKELLNDLNSLKSEIDIEKEKLKEQHDLSNQIGTSSPADSLSSNMVGKSSYQEEKLGSMAGKVNDKNSLGGKMTGSSSQADQLKSSMSGKSSAADKLDGAMSGKSGAADKLDGAMSGKSGAADKLDGAMSGKSGAADKLDGAMSGKNGAADKLDGAMSGESGAADKLDGAMSGESGAADKLDGALSGKNSKSEKLNSLKGKSNSDEVGGKLSGIVNKNENNSDPRKSETPIEKLKREKEEAEKNRPKDVLTKSAPKAGFAPQKAQKEKESPKASYETPKKSKSKEPLKADYNQEDSNSKQLEKPGIDTDAMNLEEENHTSRNKNEELDPKQLSETEMKKQTPKELEKLNTADQRDKLKKNVELEKTSPELEKLKKKENDELSVGDELPKEKNGSDVDVNFTPLKKNNKSSHDKSKNKKNDLGYSLTDEDKNKGSSEIELETEVLKQAGSLKYAEKGDLGEQTINYAELKKENGGFEIDRESSKKNNDVSDNTENQRDTTYSKMGTESQSSIKKEKKRAGKDYSIEQPKIIEAAPNGLDNLIDVFSFYFDKTKTSQDIFEHIGKYINEIASAKMIFIQTIYSKEKELIYHSGFTEAEHKDLMNLNKTKWEKTGLPIWYDETFKATTNTFLFPFYSGITSLGYVYIEFENQVTKETSMQVEVTLEGARGVYLELLDIKDGKVKNSGISLNPFKKAS